jgi:hypothetical protein
MKKKGTLFIFLTALLVNIHSCSSEKVELITINAEKISGLGVLNDTVFLRKIVDIDVYNDHFFLLDKPSMHVYELNATSQLVDIHLTQGPGPNEVGNLVNVSIHDEKIYLLDLNSMSIKSFDFDGNIYLNKKIPHPFTSDFVLNSDYIFYGNFRDKNPIRRINLKEKDQSIEFGKSRTWPNRSFEAERHLAITSDQQLVSALAYDKPILDLYELDGELITSLDLSNLDLFKYTLEKYDKDIVTKRNAALVVIQDIGSYKNKVYVLASSFSSESKNSYNQIIECVISNNEIVPTRIIKLSSSGYYLSFGVYNEGRNIVGFNVVSNNLEFFKIDN